MNLQNRHGQSICPASCILYEGRPRELMRPIASCELQDVGNRVDGSSELGVRPKVELVAVKRAHRHIHPLVETKIEAIRSNLCIIPLGLAELRRSIHDLSRVS